ncbi:MAG: hypothetical protein EPN22_09055 [Nitrospirae bacterium]|nr:MAG: hypothetical protein EPN22_09055 [Nitrospirota bacterium]
MERRVFPGKLFRIGEVIAGLIFSAAFLLFACSKAAPKCDSGKAVDAVIHEVSQDMKKDLNFLASAGSGGLSEDEWRTLRAGITITVDNIREQNYVKDSDRRTCAGTLTIQDSSGKESIPVVYVPDTDKASGEVRVTLTGYQEHKYKKTGPLISDDK